MRELRAYNIDMTTRTGTITFATDLLSDWEDSRNDNAGTAVKINLDTSGLEIFYGLYSYENLNEDEFALDINGGYEVDSEGKRKYWGEVARTEIFTGTLDEVSVFLTQKFKLQG